MGDRNKCVSLVGFTEAYRLLSSVNNPTHYFFPLNSLRETRISFDQLMFQLTNLMKTLNKPVGL